jgi:acetolactate synthase II small subunit
MIYSIHLEAESTPAMLEQVLQTTRVRGFRVRSMEVRNHFDSGRFQISLTVESRREEARLTCQLEKIPGVHELTALHAVQEGHREAMAAAAG